MTNCGRSGPSLTGPFLEKPRRRDTKRLRDLFKHHHGRVADAPLDAAHIGAVQPAFVREALLRKARLFPEFCEIAADPPAYVHGRSGPCAQLSGLQTISLILLDFGRHGSNRPAQTNR